MASDVERARCETEEKLLPAGTWTDRDQSGAGSRHVRCSLTHPSGTLSSVTLAAYTASRVMTLAGVRGRIREAREGACRERSLLSPQRECTHVPRSLFEGSALRFPPPYPESDRGKSARAHKSFPAALAASCFHFASSIRPYRAE